MNSLYLLCFQQFVDLGGPFKLTHRYWIEFGVIGIQPVSPFYEVVLCNLDKLTQRKAN